jgi:hypothetical protein
LGLPDLAESLCILGRQFETEQETRKEPMHPEVRVSFEKMKIQARVNIFLKLTLGPRNAVSEMTKQFGPGYALGIEKRSAE